jgi:hypothetical protein
VLALGSGEPTAFYRFYGQRFGFPPLTVTLVYPIYCMAVLAALTVSGRILEHRDPRLLGAGGLGLAALAVLPARHPLAGRRHLALRALADEHWIMGNPGHPCVDITEAVLAASSIAPRACHRVNDWDALISLVAQGSAVALVPALALPSDRDKIVVVPVKPSQPARNIYVAMRSGSAHAPHIAAVAQALSSAANPRPSSKAYPVIDAFQQAVVKTARCPR